MRACGMSRDAAGFGILASSSLEKRSELHDDDHARDTDILH
jgi:hypothetical protein